MITVKPSLLIGLLLLAPLVARQDDSQPPTPQPLIGFSQQSSARQLEIEAVFASVPSPQSARFHHRFLTEEPHVEGQPAQRRVAEYVLDHFQKAGIPAEIVEYHAYYPYPRSVSVHMLEPEKREFDLREAGYQVDKDSFSQDVILPFHAYSPSGEVEGQVVYANYGLPDDYAELQKQGIEVGGKVVLVRYGRSFRGVKVQVAQENGAAGVLIYSDPMDDGYFQGEVYPEGPMRPPSAIQRGSVEFIFIYPGDPLTPGRPAHADAQRITPQEAINLPRIPSQPLSYQDASEILKGLRGPVVPKGWQGALPFTYHVGPGPSRLRIRLQMDFAVRPVWNVIGRIQGADYPDEWVILGNHIDAWTYGAVDPSSGTTALLQVASGLGKLLQEGKRPRRTLILAGWGGEEYGLLGSTEWGEDLRDELMRKAVAYLNVDVGVSGSDFAAQSVPSLDELIREVTRSVRDPWSRRPVYDKWLEKQRQDDQESPPDKADPGDLGSGSDYTVFLDHLGIPSLSMGFSGPYGVYHSTYDTHYWMDRFGDRGWQYHPAIAEIWGRTALRLANADILPFHYGEYGEAISGYLQDLEKKASTIEGLGLDWGGLQREAHDMQRIGEEIRTGMAALLADPQNASKNTRINQLFRQAERGFLLEAGLPRRPWFRHSIYAPGFYTGYASLPLPGLAAAVDGKDAAGARQQAAQLLERLKRVNRTLDQVRRLTQ